MLNKSYYYQRAMVRYENTEMTDKDKRFCATVETVTIKATQFAKDVATYTVAAPMFAAVTTGCVGYMIVNGIKNEVLRSYDEYVKENGTRI